MIPCSAAGLVTASLRTIVILLYLPSKAMRYIADEKIATQVQLHYFCHHSAWFNTKRKINPQPTAIPRCQGSAWRLLNFQHAFLTWTYREISKNKSQLLMRGAAGFALFVPMVCVQDEMRSPSRAARVRGAARAMARAVPRLIAAVVSPPLSPQCH